MFTALYGSTADIKPLVGSELRFVFCNANQGRTLMFLRSRNGGGG